LFPLLILTVYLFFFSVSPVPFGKYPCITPKLIYIAEETYQMITSQKIGTRTTNCCNLI
jgi:hypothetical protein